MSSADIEVDTSPPPPHFRRGARPTRHQARRASTILRAARELTGDALDYGAGWGDLTSLLAPQFTRMVGVDADPNRVAFAAREFAPIPFGVCSASHVDFPDATFDVVFSVAVLPFVPAPVAYLAECRRVLRPGGHLVIMISNPESTWMQARRMVGRRVLTQEWGGTTRAAFRAFLDANGFDETAEFGFYDPPLNRLKTAGDVFISILDVVGHVLRVPGYWSYVAYRCRSR